MNRGIKLALYLLLVFGASYCGWQFKTNYDAIMAAGADVYGVDIIDVPLPEYGGSAPKSESRHHLGWWGAGLVFSLVGLALLLGHDVSQFVGDRALKTIYNDDGVGMTTPDYEKAEEEWNQGNFLEALRLMREYLANHPREQHVALRIAEIYEKDLHNPLAAALEYEEILKQKLPPERWGWAAIHLCNLYTGKLGQPEKGFDLLRRIVAEFGHTAAAQKARNRLEQLEADGVIPPSQATPTTDVAAPVSPRLPPGFRPKKR
jgi:hypothetical protein